MKTSSKPKQDGQNRRSAEPQNQQPTARAAAAVATSPAPAVVALPQSESSESSSSSTSSSWSTSLRDYGSGTLDTTSTSTSTAAFETGRGKVADSNRRPRYSGTAYPARRQKSASTDTGIDLEPQSRSSKFWLYSVMAIVLTAAAASVISMSLRFADAEEDDSREYVLPKRTTTVRPPQCNCADGSATNAANHDDAATPRPRRLTTFEPKEKTVAENPDAGAAGPQEKRSAVGGEDKPAAAGGGNASAVQPLDSERDAAADDGVPQKLAGKATKSLVAFKIGPGRRKQGLRTTTTSPKLAKNDADTQAARDGQMHANRGHPQAGATSSTTLKHAAGTNDKSVSSRTTVLPPKTAANAKHVVREMLEKDVNELGDRQPRGAAEKADAEDTSRTVGVANAAEAGRGT